MNSLLLSHQDHATWFYNSSGPHFYSWRNDLLNLPILLQPYNHPRTLDQLPPLTQANISPSPSESSLISEDGSQHLNVVCNVPIVVPKPRPYRSLANLQFQFELPSEDQDLSHPPYCTPRSVSKRKRSDDDDDAHDGLSSTSSSDRASKKRRAFSGSSRSLSPSTMHPGMLSRNPYSSQPVTRYAPSVISNTFRHRQPQDRRR